MNQNQRLLPIDAVRGTAMFFVGISHVSVYLLSSAPQVAWLLRAIGFFATPNFLLMSGLACGYQLAKGGTAATALRIVDRGLFVLIVGHILVASSLEYSVHAGTALEHIVITDIIGALLCMAPLLRQAEPRRLLAAGAGVFIASTAIAQTWRPTTVAGAAVAGPLLGINVRLLPDNGWISATLPLAGLFLIGVGVGKLINSLQREGRTAAAWKALLAYGAASIACGVALNVVRHLIKVPLLEHFGSTMWVDGLLAMLDVRHKVPPNPAYALFYGGIGISLVGCLGLLWGRASGLVRFLEPAIAFPATIGRASFVSYVSVQWLVDFSPRALGFALLLATPAIALAYLVAITLLIFVIARTWDRHKGNRWLTVGLKALLPVRSGPGAAPKAHATPG
jgi:hypothetical protein